MTNSKTSNPDSSALDITALPEFTALPEDVRRVLQRIADLQARSQIRGAQDLMRFEDELSDLCDQLAQAFFASSVENIDEGAPELKETASKMIQDFMQRTRKKRTRNRRR